MTGLEGVTAGQLSEKEAIRLAQEGNAEGFERIYELHTRRVFGLCLQMVKNPIEAEDLTQDAFLQTFRKIQTFRGDSLFSTWLHRVTLNIVLTAFRKKRHSPSPMDETPESEDSSLPPNSEISVPDLNLNGVIDRINLENAINQLPHGCKRLVLLHDVQGYRHGEISQILGCTVGSSKSQLRKARMRLRKLLPKPFAAAI